MILNLVGDNLYMYDILDILKHFQIRVIYLYDTEVIKAHVKA